MSQVAGDAGDEVAVAIAVAVAAQDGYGKAGGNEPIPRRSSIEKLPVLADSDFGDDLGDDDLEPTAFHRLPEEIIQQ